MLSRVATGALILVGALVLNYMVSQFLRGSVAVIAPDLTAAVGLTAGELGLLSSVFFFTFAAAQLPLGVALDRYGPRRVLMICATLTIAGTVLFALSHSARGLIAGRALMGLGVSSSFMAALAVYARRFPPERFGTLTGLHYGIGSTGSLLATAPLAWAAAMIGWRGSFLAVAGVNLVIALIVVAVLKDASAGPPLGRRERLGEALAGIWTVMRMASVGRLFLMNLAAYSSFALFVALWGGPYLSHVYGFGLTERGDLLLVPALAQMLGAFLWGPTDRLFRGHKLPVALGAVGTVLCLAVVALWGQLPFPALIVWMAVFGAVSAFSPVLISHGRVLFPPHLIGRGLTLMNMATMGGVFATQTASGLVIDMFPTAGGVYPLAAYQLVFGLQGLLLLLALLAYLGARDPLRDDARASHAPGS